MTQRPGKMPCSGRLKELRLFILSTRRMRVTWLQHTSTFSGRKHQAWQNVFNPSAKGRTRSKSWKQKAGSIQIKNEALFLFYFSIHERLTIIANQQRKAVAHSSAAAAGLGSVGMSKGWTLGLNTPVLGVLWPRGWDLHWFASLQVFPTSAPFLLPGSPLLKGKVCLFPAPHSHHSPQMHLIHTGDNDRKLQCNRIMGFIYRICFPITPTWYMYPHTHTHAHTWHFLCIYINISGWLCGSKMPPGGCRDAPKWFDTSEKGAGTSQIVSSSS